MEKSSGWKKLNTFWVFQLNGFDKETKKYSDHYNISAGKSSLNSTLHGVATLFSRKADTAILFRTIISGINNTNTNNNNSQSLKKMYYFKFQQLITCRNAVPVY